MQLSLQLSKLQGTTSYFDGNMGRVGVKSDTVIAEPELAKGLKIWGLNPCSRSKVSDLTLTLPIFPSIYDVVPCNFDNCKDS